MTSPTKRECQKCSKCYKVPPGFSVEQCREVNCPCHKPQKWCSAGACQGFQSHREKDCPYKPQEGSKERYVGTKVCAKSGNNSGFYHVADCLCGKPPEEPTWREEFRKKFVTAEEISEKTDPKMWGYGIVCDHDDFTACEERLKVVESFIEKLLEREREKAFSPNAWKRIGEENGYWWKHIEDKQKEAVEEERNRLKEKIEGIKKKYSSNGYVNSGVIEAFDEVIKSLD